MDRIKVGHIGTKHDHSKAKLDAVLKRPDLFEVVGIVPQNTDEYIEKMKKDPVYSKVPVMTEEELFAVPGLELVLLEGFELESVPAAKRCVDRGLHIHLDKPGGDDIVLYEDVLRTAKAKNLIVQLGYMYRYNPAVLYLHELINEGKIGELTAIDTQMSTEHAPWKVQWLSCFRGGVMFWLGCHLVDLIYRIAGVPEEIIPMNNRSGFYHPETYDNTFAILKYPKFIATVRVNSTEINGYGRRQLVVCGRNGSVEIKPLENPIKMTYSDHSITGNNAYRNSCREVELPLPTGRYDTMVEDLYGYIRGTKANPYSYEYELQLQKMVLAVCGFDVDWKNVVKEF